MTSGAIKMHNPNADAIWTLSKRADSLNADALFITSKLKNAKTLTKLKEFKPEYDFTRSLIGVLLIDISNSHRSQSLTYRTMSKRLRYVDDYLRREYESKKHRFEKLAQSESLKAASTISRSSKLNAKLLAKFIIDEAIKLNNLQRDKPSTESDLSHHVSKVSSTSQASVALLSAALTNDESATEEIDFLGGMDEVL